MTVERNVKFTATEPFIELSQRFLQYDPYILSFHCEDGISNAFKIYGDSCAARNRLLTAIHGKCLAEDYTTPDTCQYLWRDAAQVLLESFQQVPKSAEFVQKYVKQKQEWIEDCDYRYRLQETDTSLWQFMQFAQMGSEGFTSFLCNFSDYAGATVKFKCMF